MEHRRRSGRPSARSPPTCCDGCATTTAPAASLHFGQGKWYPGEPLPRWALNCYWRARRRADRGRDPALFADERDDDGATTARRASVSRGLATRLGVDPTHVFPAYEDVWYYLWRERRLPVNVDPFDARLDDELERERLRRVFDAGLDSVVGYVLPLARDDDGQRTALAHRPLVPARRPLLPGPRRFAASATACRSTRCPGSRAGRLPVAVSTATRWRLAARCRATGDPRCSAGRERGSRETGASIAGAATCRRATHRQQPGSHAAIATRRPAPVESAAEVTRTALCAEPRDGRALRLHAAADALEDYLELVAAVEATARGAAACRSCSKAIRRRATRA